MRTNEYLARIREDVGSLKNNLAQDAEELRKVKEWLFSIAKADDTRGKNPKYKYQSVAIMEHYTRIEDVVDTLEDGVIGLQHDMTTFEYYFGMLKERIGQGEIVGHLEFDEWEYTE